MEHAYPWLITVAALLIWFAPSIRAKMHGVGGMSPKMLEKAMRDGSKDLVVLDVRSDGEFAEGHIPGAKHLPLDKLGDGLKLLSALRKDDVVCVCASGKRSAVAAVWLKKAGFDHVYNLSGGMMRWGKRDVQRD